MLDLLNLLYRCVMETVLHHYVAWQLLCSREEESSVEGGEL